MDDDSSLNGRLQSPPVVLFTLIVTTAAAISISILCLSSGYYMVFQNVFYIPIIIACVYFTRRGFMFSVVLAAVYFLLIAAYTAAPQTLGEAGVRVGIFLLVAGTVTYLSGARKQLDERLHIQLDRLEETVQRRVEEAAADHRQAESDAALNLRRMESLLQLNQMTGASPQEITDFALEEAVRLTGSRIGYLAFLNEDESVLTMHSWSWAAMAQCAVADKPFDYPVASTGLWGEAVRQRRPMITNEYTGTGPWQKGTPQGHVALTRHMNVPVFDGSRIVIVAGVGNKEGPYDQSDVHQVTLLMKDMWHLLERNRAEARIRDVGQQWQRTFDSAGDVFMVMDRDFRVARANARTAALLNLPLNEIIGRHCYELMHGTQSPIAGCPAAVLMASNEHEEAELFLEGKEIWASVSVDPYQDDRGQLAGFIHVVRDVTASRAASEVVRDSERTLLESQMIAGLGTYAFDIASESFQASTVMEEMLGIDATYDHSLAGWAARIHPDDRPEVMNALRTGVIGRGQPFDAELRVVRYDNGAVRWLHVLGKLECDADGRPAAVRGTAQDITGRKQAEATLQESEARYKSLFEANHAVMLILDPDTSAIVDANPAACAFYGWSRAEMLSMHIDQINTLSPAEITAEMAAARKEERNHFLFKHRRADGAIRDVEVYSGPLVLQGKTQLYSIVHDVTERRQAEEAVRDSESKYRNLFETADDAILLFAEGTWVDCNASAMRIFGCARDQIIGAHPNKFSPPSQPDGRPSEEEAIKRINLAFVEGPQTFEWVHWRADKTLFFAEVSLHRLDLAGKPHIQAIVRDVTERRRAQEAIAHQNAELTVLNQIGQTLSRLAEPAEVFERIFTELGKVLDNRNAYITSFDREKQYLPFEVYTEEGVRRSGLGRPLADGVTDYIVRNNTSLLIKEEMPEVRRRLGFVRRRGRPACSLLGVPMRAGDDVIGVIVLQDYDHENVFNEHHLELLTTIAAQASSALENARLYAAAQQELAERKRSEMALAESRALQDAIVDSTTDLIWSVDPERFGLQTFNRSIGEHYLKHYSICLKPGDRPEELFPPGPFVQRWKDLYGRALTEGAYSTEYASFDGSMMMVLNFNTITRAGAVVGVSVFGHDVTESRRAIQALQDSEERYRLLFDAIPESVLVIGTDRRVVAANQASARLYGYDSPRELEGFDTRMLIAERDRGRAAQTQTKVLRGNGIPARQYIEVRRDGSEFMAEVTSTTLYGPQQEVAGYIGITRDITALAKAEEEVRELNLTLENRVRQRTEQLAAANAELEAFAYSVSHDLRAPLRAIDGFTSILVEGYESVLDAEGMRLCTIIRHNAGKMGRLIDDLLAFSRLGRAGLAPSRIDMTGMANSLYHELTTPESRERIEFHVDALPEAVGDTSMMRQVWLNLLGNAIKFSSKREPARIDVRGEQVGAEFIYTVEDNGAGFDMTYAHKLFGVFQRLHTEREFEGTGVGLALVQRIIHRHGGRVWAEGEPDRGAAFHFSIPQEPQEGVLP